MNIEGGKHKPFVAFCGCTGVAVILAKSAAAKMKPENTNIPFHCREKAAKEQDAKYGVGRRLHNVRVKDGRIVGSTCTVCGQRKLQ